MIVAPVMARKRNKVKMNMRQYAKCMMVLLLTAMVVGSAAIPAYSGRTTDGPEQRAASDSLTDVVPDSSYGPARRIPVMAQIHMLARTYGDSIVLRWAGEDYVTQQSLYRTGVDIYRVDSKGGADSLVGHLKPWTLDQLREFYPQSDSVALMVMELMSGKRMQPDQTRNMPGTMGALLELHDDQQTRFGFSVLLSEWRPDLANKMAMRWVDYDVKPGETYEYILQPSTRNPNASMMMGAGHVKPIENKTHERESLDIEMGDSVIGPLTTCLWWNGTEYSCFEVERRAEGETEWTRLNEHPVLFFNTNGDEATDITYRDNVPAPGRYYYRVIAHDAFGDMTRPSKPYLMVMPDLNGPMSPVIQKIEVDRRNEADLSKEVFATFHISCDSIAPDFEGYLPVYYHKKLTNGEWKMMTDEKLGANDTVFTVDVSGLSTGMVSVGAVDKNGNVSYSMPTLLALKDMKAPDAPTNLKAYTNAQTGTIKLVWESDEADIEYFEVQAANDTTHEFMNVASVKEGKHYFVDSVDTEVNQKYIYYRVRAIDYSTNEGAFTPVLAVVRPSTLAPSPAHLETSRVEQDGIHLRWGLGDDQQNSFHILVRKAEGDEKWTVVRRWEADSLVGTDHMVDVVDNPPYDRNHNYIYGVTSVALNGLNTTSMLVSLAYNGPAYFDWDIKLSARYDKAEKQTRLAYETDTKLPYKSKDWFFTVYRKRAGEKEFSFYKSTPSNEQGCFDPHLDEGEEAEYYVFIQFPDGCKSSPSNTIRIKAQ